MVAALTALLLLSYASVQSIIMQTQMAAAAGRATALSAPQAESQPSASTSDVMTGMAGMAMAGGDMAVHGPSKAGEAKPAQARAPLRHDSGGSSHCPYCAAAAHVPVVGVTFALRAPTITAFAAYRTVPSLGPRGPPRFEPHARGPPGHLRSVLNRVHADPARTIVT